MNAKRFWYLVSSLAILCSLPVLAAETPLRQALLQCQQQQSATQRLDCYDQLASSLTPQAKDQQRAAERRAPQASERKAEQTAFSTPAATAAETVSRPAATKSSAKAAVATETEDDFGKTQPVVHATDRIYATVTSVRQEHHGHLLITFDNGHVWRQINSENYPIQAGEEHFIRRAMFGSFLLGNERNNRTTRVRRVE